ERPEHPRWPGDDATDAVLHLHALGRDHRDAGVHGRFGVRERGESVRGERHRHGGAAERRGSGGDRPPDAQVDRDLRAPQRLTLPSVRKVKPSGWLGGLHHIFHPCSSSVRGGGGRTRRTAHGSPARRGQGWRCVSIRITPLAESPYIAAAEEPRRTEILLSWEAGILSRMSNTPPSVLPRAPLGAMVPMRTPSRKTMGSVFIVMLLMPRICTREPTPTEPLERVIDRPGT